MISRTDFLRASNAARRCQPEFSYGGLSLGIGLGLSRLGGRAGGVVPNYPAAVVSAGAQLGWNQRNTTGPLTPPTKIADGVATLPTGWAYSPTLGLTTNSHNTDPLDGWITNGRPIVTRHNNVTIRNCIVTNNGSYTTAPVTGIGVGTTGVATDNTVIEFNEIDGQGEITTTRQIGPGIAEHASYYHSNLVIRGNYIHGHSDDCIQINSDGVLIELNRLCVGGWNWPVAHWDALQTQAVQGAGNLPIIYRRNFIDATPGIAGSLPSPSTIGRTYGRTSCFAVSGCPGGVQMYENVLFYGAEVLDADGVGGQNMMSVNANNFNIEVRNNAMSWWTAVIHPNSQFTINTWANNYRMSSNPALDGLLVSQPAIKSTQWMCEDGTFWRREDDASYGWLREESV